MPHVTHATLALGDVDDDGDLDVYLSGVSGGAIVTGLYLYRETELRDGLTTFIFEQADAPLTELVYGSAAWGDFDGDGDIDLVASGSRTIDRPYELATMLYRNDGGRLVATDVSLEGFHSGAAECGDFDDDGDLDLLIGGEDVEGRSRTILYRNEGGDFVDAEAGLPGLAFGAARFGDVDSDGDLDLALAGVGEDGTYAAVYRNAAGTFTIWGRLEPLIFASFEWGNMDDDDDLELLQSGGRLDERILSGVTRLYTPRSTRFDSVEVGLFGGLSGRATWGDYDQDGDLDVFVIGGATALGARRATVFENTPDDFFPKSYLIGVVFGEGSFGDIDGDGDLDLLTGGLPSAGTPLLNLYENRRQVITPLSAPEELSARVDGSAVRLEWGLTSGAASYNVRVGTQPGASDVLSPMAASSGRRLIAARGNADAARSIRLENLPRGTYYWSVQSIDHSYRGSKFSPEQTFSIASVTSVDEPQAHVELSTRLHPPTPNPSEGPVTLRYEVARPSRVRIQILDVLGRRLATIVDGDHAPGAYVAEWDTRSATGSSVSSGLYVCVFEAGTHREARTLVLSR